MVAEIRIEQTTIDKLIDIDGVPHKVIAIMKTGKDRELVTVILEDGSVITLPKEKPIKVY